MVQEVPEEVFKKLTGNIRLEATAHVPEERCAQNDQGGLRDQDLPGS